MKAADHAPGDVPGALCFPSQETERRSQARQGSEGVLPETFHIFHAGRCSKMLRLVLWTQPPSADYGFAVLCLALLFTLCGCLRQEPRADLAIINGQEPGSLDPAIVTGLE